MIVDREKRSYGRDYVLYEDEVGSRLWMPVVYPVRYNAGDGLNRWLPGTVGIHCPFCPDDHTHDWEPGPRWSHCVPYRVVPQYAGRDEPLQYYIECEKEDPRHYQRWLERQQDMVSVSGRAGQ